MKLNLLQALARQEGWWVMPGDPNFPTRVQRNNSPGDLRYEDWIAKDYGAINDGSDYSKFRHAGLGWAAFKALMLGPVYKGKTVRAALNIFAPAADGNAPEVYVTNVCDFTGTTPDTVIDGLI